MAVNVVGDNQLGNYLKIYSQNSVYSNLSEQSAMWKNILKKRKGPEGGREIRYLLRSAFGAGAFQFVGVNGAVQYPNAAQATINEGTAQFKDFAVTVEVERTLISKAIDDFRRYGEPLAEELKSKTIATARGLSAYAYQSGLGIIGTVESAPTSFPSGNVVLKLSTADSDMGESHVGWFEFGDKLKIRDNGDTADQSPIGGTAAYYIVVDKDRDADTVELQAFTSGDVAITATAAGDLSANDRVYRFGTSSLDVSAIVKTGALASRTEYGTLSEVFLGMESLTADDGRKVNNIAMESAIKGTRYDAGGDAIDSLDFQRCMSQVKIAVGEGRYKWNDAIMAPEALDALVESRETDRRFHSIQDTDRGVPRLGYVHGNDRLMFMSDEYCQKKRVWICPQADVIQFWGADFEFVRPEGGQRFFLRPDGTGGHYRQVRAYMEGSGLLKNIHPAACGVITNFTF